jgi:hypothetical protein
MRALRWRAARPGTLLASLTCDMISERDPGQQAKDRKRRAHRAYVAFGPPARRGEPFAVETPMSDTPEVLAGRSSDEGEGLSLGHVSWLRQCIACAPLGVVPAWFARDLLARGLVAPDNGGWRVTAAGRHLLRQVLIRRIGVHARREP